MTTEHKTLADLFTFKPADGGVIATRQEALPRAFTLNEFADALGDVGATAFDLASPESSVTTGAK